MSHKEVAKNAVNAAWICVYRARTLREVASYIAEHHDDSDCKEVGRWVEELNSLADDRIHSALEAISIVGDYLREKPAAKKTVESKTQPVRQELNASAAASGSVQ
jgi:deoxyribodipyrimidine photolyase